MFVFPFLLFHPLLPSPLSSLLFFYLILIPFTPLISNSQQKLGKLLGKGAYGVVFKAISTGGSMAGATVAVKQLYLQSVSSNIAKTLQVWES